MTDQFLGEIRLFAMNFAPSGWALCNGQTLSIQQNTALFSLIGTFYGGNGTTTFNLPNLQGRAPIHVDSTSGTILIGQSAGESTHQLIAAELPAHTHAVSARASATQAAPSSADWAGSSKAAFAGSATTVMNPAALSTAGGGQPHDNMPPYLVLNYAIALQGIFPSRN